MERWFIKATPVLGCKSSEAFLKKVEAAEKIKTGPVPTPKLAETLRRFIEDMGTDTDKLHRPAPRRQYRAMPLHPRPLRREK